MENKEYSPQEMRKRAAEFDEYLGNEDHFVINAVDNDARMLSAMLHQAAEMRERCEKIQKHFAMTRTEREMIDYILHGDTGKEAK